MRRCPFNDCQATVPSDVFACRKHWFSLNTRQRATIWDAYRKYTADKIGMEELARIQQAILDDVQGGVQ